MYHQMPGIDMLGRQLCEDGMCQQFGNIRAVRELASAANQAGAKRRFSETYGGAGWQVSFTDLKRLVDWECVLGVNFVNQHLSYFSMQGVRKFDYPPSFSYHEPWWNYHSLLGDYTARMSMALSAGEQINKVLIIQPNTTAWMYHSDADRHDQLMDISVVFKKFIVNLEASQLEYDLGSEQVIKRFGEITKEGLRVGERVYSKIILPPGMRNIDSSTQEFIDQFADAGHELLVLSDSIDHINGSQVNEGALYNSKEHKNLAEWFGQDDCIIKTVTGNPALVFHQRRILQDAELLFIINSDQLEAAEVDILMKGKYLSEIDLLTGDILPMEYIREKENVKGHIKLNPVGSRMLVISNKKLAKAKKREAAVSDLPLDGPCEVKRLSDNILTIDFLKVETAEYHQEDAYFMNAMYKLFDWSGLATGNPWQHKIQFRKTYLEMDEFDETSWHNIRYSFEIDKNLSSEQMKSLRLVAERPEIWTVEINGLEIHPLPGEWWLDKHFPVYPIGLSTHPGRNTVTLKAKKMSVFAEIMPIYILGDFCLEESEKGFLITAPKDMSLGSWKDLGMPFYGDKVEYMQVLSLQDDPDAKESYILKLQDWQGIAGEIIVNEQAAGFVGWQTEMDISEFLKSGKNEVRFVISGSLKNTLGFHHKDLTGWIDGPFSWNQAPDHQPPGGEYRFMEYGMMTPFRIFKK